MATEDLGAPEVVVWEITPAGEFGGHEFEYEQVSDLFKCTRPGCGQYEIVARQKAEEQGIGEITRCQGTPPGEGSP